MRGMPGRGYVIAQIVLLTALSLDAIAAVRHARGLRRAMGLSAVGAGGGLVVTAAVSLGRELRADPVPSEHAVLRMDGPYADVRHPIYSGLLLAAFGLALLAWRPRAFVLVAALFGVLMRKTGLEERLLRERFAEYEDYAARTPRFLPKMLRFW
jgi:protein-S-isoprenylcysteine O-methyltransferase Ste14